MWIALIHLHLHTPLDPLHGDGYQWWSGLGSGSAWVAAGSIYVRHHNCHVRGCWRLGRVPVRGTQHVVCRKHHPDDAPSSGKVAADHARVIGRRRRGHEDVGRTTSDGEW